MNKIKVAILDDYQNVSHDFVDWQRLSEKIELDVFNEYIGKDKNLSNCQIRRFLVLHKELDPDDGEITRTRKVRRNLVSDKYSDLIKALYDGSKEIYTETEVTYEDGRKGKISASIVIQELEEAFEKVKVA